jgi:hypothetical protein
MQHYSWAEFFEAFAPNFGYSLVKIVETDYQGEGLVLLQDTNKTLFVTSFYYGSCSHCDRLEYLYFSDHSDSELEVEYATVAAEYFSPEKVQTLPKWFEVTFQNDLDTPLFDKDLEVFVQYLKDNKLVVQPF